ncbi:hypothetical protein ACOSP7_018058 [Xanthoceras sorbifolium]|uniref:Protein PHYTOCHROME KINASE SUBSTRATE 1-like n=1 Tax=Xanthoceras sorbifolium TaxID=99658 RepID=A0ABQ8I0F7_9ROSI|nr:hypothetical protein JRO89_XS05G0046000 [Xanthoceras sorbifolium]
MAMVNLPSSLSQKLSNESNDNNLRDASFSSYLNGAEETFVRKLAQSSQNLSPVMSTKQEEQHYLERKKEEDGEIGVFSAEKYFNGVVDDSPRVPKLGWRNPQDVKDHERMNLAPAKAKIQSGTPSVHSESSWNSQSALLHSALRNPSRRKENKAQKKNFLASYFRCKCSCSDKDSIEITEHVGEASFKRSPNCSVVQSNAIPKGPIKAGHHIDTIQIDETGSIKEDLGLIRENCFSFQTTNSGVGNLPVKIPFQEDQEEEKTRKSIEVFGCSVLEKRNKSSSLEKRLTMLSWDATPRVEDIKFSATHGENFNDTESDASSDLFEIESLTGKANAFLARQGSDATSDCITPTGYAPSEASIEWSVVTASAADFSVMSDSEELRPATAMTSPVKVFSATSNAKTRTSMEMPRRRPSISLSCKSQKAVRVAGDAYRTYDKANYDLQMRQMSDSFTPMTRFQAETKLTSFDSKQRQHAVAATRSLPRSHSPRPSHLLFIQ